MSENTSTNSEDIPQEVKDLQEVLGDFAAYRTVIASASFQGAHLEPADKLRKFINNSYNDFLAKFNNHPYVLKARADQDALQKETNRRTN